MKIIDGHIHSCRNIADPSFLIERLDSAGVWGTCVFSAPPLEHSEKDGVEFFERIDKVISSTKGYEDRLFPVLWIHPYEEDILNKVHIAVEKGICAFKMICSNFYVYEEKSLALLKEIASLKKSVFFHSGILWDGQVSSSYNRPINFESLIHIKGLKFSLGHCSWPWIDECVALYGKFMNTYNSNTEIAEMFFDTTPGTPEIYRKELLTKLFTIGYDVESNIFFGTDCSSNNYNTTWAKKWLEIDRKIMDDLGVSKRVREKMYYNNLLRFLGKSNEQVTYSLPETDDSHAWSCENPETKEIICAWAEKLEIPNRLTKPEKFYSVLNSTPISDAITIENYDCDCTDGKRNLLSALFMCQKLAEEYAKKGIDESILLDTLSDIGTWFDTWSDLKKEMYLGELSWLKRHLSMKLFKLGRLQFCMAEAEVDCGDLKKGDNVIEVHIPEGTPLTDEECEKSFIYARKFFAKYFPEYEYKYFTCHSWMLDPTLEVFLNQDSNIIKFQKRFELGTKDVSDAILKYLFKWNTTKYNLPKAYPLTSLAKKVKDFKLAGGVFYEVLGLIKK